MDWTRSTLPTELGPFDLIHFDSVESPIVAESVVADDTLDRAALERCEDLLGSVLWLDAIALFIPFLFSEFNRARLTKATALCLGEGTGAVGCGIARSNAFNRIIITDLPALLPLLQVNAALAPSAVGARSLDWMKPDIPDLFQACDVVIGCEVLYGNRFAWTGLMDTILHSVKPKTGVVYLCVTLRNARLDLDDFTTELKTKFSTVSHHPLSDSVVVIRASRRLGTS